MAASKPAKTVGNRSANRSAHQTEDERYYVATQWQLMARKFSKHKLAGVSLWALAALYLIAFTYEFWAPYHEMTQNVDYASAPPSRLHILDTEGRLRGPFVYGMKKEFDSETFTRKYTEDESRIHPIRFFQRGETYRFWGLLAADMHFFGTSDGKVFLLGTDALGRDLFTRTLAGSRISLSIGLVGVVLCFVLGSILGGISGYFGGTVDLIIQRVIEFLFSLPTIPIWMALSAAVPARWSPVNTYFAVTVILSLVGWTGLARVVRGKLLQLRESDFVMASKISGATDSFIIARHLLPGFASYLIVSLTLAVPRMIIAETALSFLGLGIRPPAISWGVLLKDAQNIHSIAVHPWMLIPGLFVVVAVLLFNFVGDGLRDAADPYK